VTADPEELADLIQARSHQLDLTGPPMTTGAPPFEEVATGALTEMDPEKVADLIDAGGEP
jgi:hypothetical protein